MKPSEMGAHLSLDLADRGALGFTSLARGAAQIAKILFFLFLAIFIVIVILALFANQLVF